MNLGRRPRRLPEPYQDYRAPLQARWRPVILQRDRSRCRACAGRPLPGAADPELDVAHITDAVAFVRAAGHARGVTFSYRWDNLVTLCRACHRASHAHRPTAEQRPRRERVEALFERLRRLRGWSTPFAALPPSLVPPALRPARSFHDVMRVSPLVPFPTYARYAADGGLVYAEAPPAPASQARLAGDSPGAPSARPNPLRS